MVFMDGLIMYDKLYSTGAMVMIYCGNSSSSDLGLAIGEFNSSANGPKPSGKKLKVSIPEVDLAGIKEFLESCSLIFLKLLL